MQKRSPHLQILTNSCNEGILVYFSYMGFHSPVSQITEDCLKTAYFILKKVLTISKYLFGPIISRI